MNDNFLANDNKVSVEQLLYRFFVKFDKLKDLLYNIKYIPESNIIDIYVDLFSMYKPLYENDIYTDNRFTIVSGTINLIAHIRQFFASRFNIATRIFMVYGDGTANNHNIYCPEYSYSLDMGRYPNNTINYQAVMQQLDMARTICAYIRNAYIIKRTTDFAMFTYDNIMKNNNASIIFSREIYSFQIPALIPSCLLIRPLKSNGDDISVVVHNHNVLEMFFNKVRSDKNINKIRSLNPALLNIFMALHGIRGAMPSYNYGDKVRNNATTVIKLIFDAVMDNKIINGYNTQPILFEGEEQEGFVKRLYAADINHQHRLYQSMAESKDISWCIDVSNPYEVQRINNVFFQDRPLDLEWL